ncbi:MAG TPA: aldo/keto reductase [Conexibacter sp.]|jgi:aryl-alcohol dehydrogenase-like predicted oxidoreductase
MHLTDFRTLGPSGLRVSPLTLGAMTFGNPSWGTSDEDSWRIIDRYLAAGGNVIDTASLYTSGRSEQAIGAYLAQHPGVRDRLVLSTKFGGSLVPDDPNAGGNGRKAIMQALEGSLRRLGTDYVDLYWLHNWDPHTPLEETMATLDGLVGAGKVRYIGLSNVPAWAVARACTTAELRGRAAPIALQAEYSLLARSAEGGSFGVARELGLGVTPWSPLHGGVLSGKYSRVRPTSDTGRAVAAPLELSDEVFALLDVIERIADEAGGSVAAVALAWVRRQPLVTTTLLGARTVAQLEANLASLEVELTDAQAAELDALTTPVLEYPLTDQLLATGPGVIQGDTTVNGVRANAIRL